MKSAKSSAKSTKPGAPSKQQIGATDFSSHKKAQETQNEIVLLVENLEPDLIVD